jgi:hypothetical protein
MHIHDIWCHESRVRTIFIEAAFLGVAAGNLWSAPFIGGGPWVAALFIAACLFFSARHASGNRFVRTALVALAAWPVAIMWQALHGAAPDRAESGFQAMVLLGTSQLAALAVRRKPDDRQE